MRFLHVTLLYCVLPIFSSDRALEYPRSSPPDSSTSITATSVLEADGEVATNIIFQSNDAGQTWQDISVGLPANEQLQDFFAGESEIYLRVKNGMYRSKSNLKTPVWEKENSVDLQSTFNRANVVEAEGVLIMAGSKGIARSTDKGEHWEWVISEGGVGIDVERIEGGFAAITYSSITKSRRIRISMDKGKTWQAIDEGLRSSLSITSIRQVGNYLICGHPDGIFRSSDMGKTWSRVHSSVNGTAHFFYPVSEKVFAIYVSGNIVYAVARNAGC